MSESCNIDVDHSCVEENSIPELTKVGTFGNCTYQLEAFRLSFPPATEFGPQVLLC